ncbi:RICIN domain-containing protein [Kibdelosporangium aridum]|uniref:RICIN domain-containing protein n=1 Tax=Kibdelosporangium aridum TaxID=2030 RepID=UPI000526F291
MVKTRILVVFAVISALLFTALATPASAEVRYNVLIQNSYTRKCLDVRDWSKENLAPVVQFDCHGGANQQWTLNTQTGIVTNAHSGKCLEIIGWVTGNGAYAVQYDCHYGANQQWNINRSNGVMVNRHSQKFLFVLNNSTANLAHVGQWDYNTSGPAVHWNIG